MGTILDHVRYNARMPRHNAAVTLIAALALAVGIGSSIARLGAVDGVPLRSMILDKPSGAMTVSDKSTIADAGYVSPASYPDWKSQNRVFGDLKAVVGLFPISLTGAGKPEELMAGAVTANFFQMIGVEPVIGRGFLPGDGKRGHNRVVILSHQLWRRRFAQDIGMVGKSIVLSGERYEVVGILPPDFNWNDSRTDVWVPYGMDPNRDDGSTRGRYVRVAVRPAKVDSVASWRYE